MSQLETQNIEGASLLSSLAGLFFKGLDNALTRAAEYEEEMGVLKQINRIPIETLDGDKKYTLTIKLSPVRNHDSFYFVEAETDAPGLDVSSIKNKTMKIDNTTLKQFQNLIDKMISKSNYTADMEREEDNTSDAEVVGEPTDEGEKTSEEGSITREGEIEALLESAQDWLSRKSVVAYKGSILASINVEFAKPTDKDVEITISATDALENKGESIKSVKDQQYTLDLVDTDGDVVTENAFLESLSDAIDDFLKINNMTGKQFVQSSTKIAAKFIKDSEGIGLVAINASSDLDSAMSIIYEVMDSDEFADSLEEGEEASFLITEDDDNYNVEPFDAEVDVSGTLQQLYQEVSKMYITLKSLEEMIGYKEFQNVSYLNSIYSVFVELEAKVALWITDKVNPIDILQDPFQLVPTFAAYRQYGKASGEGETLDPELQDQLNADIERLIEVIQFLSVNLMPEQQQELDLILDELQKALG